MDPVSNATRIAMLLRQRLQERARSGAAERGRKATSGADGLRAKGPVRGADALEGLDDRRLKRALIENVLAEQFGPAMLNDAKFQQVVDRVAEAIEADAGGGVLLEKAIAGLRAGAG
jgi:hypothetical protein